MKKGAQPRKSDRPKKPTPARPAWVVYILRCADGTFYTGVTVDLDRRFRQHNAGRASRYTRGRRPVGVVYHEPQPTHGDALRREAAIKALTRRQKERLVRAARDSA